jgi:hypothetical protein
MSLQTGITAREGTQEQLKTSLKEINDLKAALDKHAIVAITERDDLKLAVRGLEGGGFGTMLDGTRRDEGGLIGGCPQEPFRQRMVG